MTIANALNTKNTTSTIQNLHIKKERGKEGNLCYQTQTKPH
jgi:hypothetical protein